MIQKLLFVLALFPTILQAQPYLNNTSKWQFRGGTSDFNGNLYTLDRLFYLDGDTAFNGETYRKLYLDQQDTIRSIFTNTITGFDTTKHTYYAAIRESGQQFFMVLAYASSETLIQDFDLHTGDTVQSDICDKAVVVTGIDTVFLGNTPLRRYFLNGYTNEYILEGIGGTSGFRISCPGEIGFEYNLDPVCYSRDDINIPVQLNYGDCNIVSATKYLSASQPVRVFPNPSRGMIYLDLSEQVSVEKIQVWNSTGISFNASCAWHNGERFVNLSGLPGGVYFLAFQAGGQMYRSAVVLSGR